jgi:hypothetical protein
VRLRHVPDEPIMVANKANVSDHRVFSKRTKNSDGLLSLDFPHFKQCVNFPVSTFVFCVCVFVSSAHRPRRPMVWLEAPRARVRVNFGQAPFAFDFVDTLPTAWVDRMNQVNFSLCISLFLSLCISLCISLSVSLSLLSVSLFSLSLSLSPYSCCMYVFQRSQFLVRSLRCAFLVTYLLCTAARPHRAVACCPLPSCGGRSSLKISVS